MPTIKCDVDHHAANLIQSRYMWIFRRFGCRTADTYSYNVTEIKHMKRYEIEGVRDGLENEEEEDVEV